jgi:ethanolamine ammonia-lyase large subunit
MRFGQTIRGVRSAFGGLKELLAKASAASAEERIAARIALADVPPRWATQQPRTGWLLICTNLAA